MPQEFEAGLVLAARLLCPQIRNITIVAESLSGFAFEPGADMTIRLPGADGSADERHYSVWKSSAHGEFEVCVVLHGLGLGSRWAAHCAIGDTVEISRSHVLPIALDRSTEAHLFFGGRDVDRVSGRHDPRFAGGCCVFACFEISSMERRWPDSEIFRPEAVRWVDRAGRAGSALVSWLAGQSLPLEKPTAAYVTGEAWLCAIVHAHLVRERGFPPRAVRAMPYWKSRSKSL